MEVSMDRTTGEGVKVYDGRPRRRCSLSLRTAFVAAMLALCAAPLPLRADTVVLRNGDRISGTIAGLEGNKLVVRTEYAGEIKIELKAIDSFASEGEVTSVLKSETRLFGQVQGSADSILIYPTSGEPTQKVPTLDLVTIEQGRIEREDWRWSGRIALGASSSRGNSQLTRLYGDAEAVARQERNRFTFGGRGAHASDAGKETESNAVAYLKYDHFLLPRWYAYASSTLEYDPFRDIQLRTTLGLGSGYQFIETLRTNLSLEGGLDYVHTDFYSAADASYPAARLALRVDHWLVADHMQFFHKSEGYAALDQIQRSFVRTQTGLRFPLRNRFLAQAQLNYDWDGDPQPGRKAVDQTLVFSLGYKW
jgi:putative salt-induced outer membrane protein YdiY